MNAFGIGADNQRRGDDREGHLEHKEQVFRNGAGHRVDVDAGKERLSKPAPPGISVSECDRIGDHKPEN